MNKVVVPGCGQTKFAKRRLFWLPSNYIFHYFVVPSVQEVTSHVHYRCTYIHLDDMIIIVTAMQVTMVMSLHVLCQFIKSL